MIGKVARNLLPFAPLAVALMALVHQGAPAQSKKAVPYWASITADEARMRVGPSLDYPSNWVYRRRDLPVKVVQVLGNWRKVEDSEGTQGWMHVRLLADTATGIVKGEMAMMRQGPDIKSKVLFRAEPGVVGRLSDCAAGWCAFNVRGQAGYVSTDSIWGATGP